MPDKYDHSDSGMEPDILRHHTPPRLRFYGVVALCIAAIVAAGGLAFRYYSSARTEQWTEDQAVPSVQTIALNGAKNAGILAAQILALHDTSIAGKLEAYKEYQDDIVLESVKNVKMLGFTNEFDK